MPNRRDFLRASLLGVPALGLVGSHPEHARGQTRTPRRVDAPLVISTWSHGTAANRAAWRTLADGGKALDAVEHGVRVSEADPKVSSVGYGGLPDRDGHVTLDACIMDGQAQCGAVAFLQHIKHPISVARQVMEETPHVMLVGSGALQFALEQGFEKENLLTAKAEAAWREWKRKNATEPVRADQHDTIGMLALDSHGALAGACTTSGLAWKRHGRVGDSPIIGAALYVDDEVGGACATGHGEAVIRTAGTSFIVERMRAGRTPQQACRDAIERVVRLVRDIPDLQVGYLAVGRSGAIGAFSVQPGFQYALRDGKRTDLIDAPSLV